MYPFERFTEPAKRVLSGAQEEAEVAGHNYIGTEHLLLGILRSEQGVASRALAGLGIELDEVRRVISAVLGRGEALKVSQIIPTTRVKKVIEISFAEALRGGRHHVGTAHLLLALVIEKEGIAAHVLKDMNATRDKIEAAIAEVEAGGLKEAAGPPVATHSVPVGTGTRVLVHEPEPPHRLWEGRVSGAGPAGVEVEVPDRPAGAKMVVEARFIHPIPTGPTLYCPYCTQR